MSRTRPTIIGRAVERLRGLEARLSDARVALAGAVALALGHYVFGEWVFHPGIALWRERAFWAEMPLAAIVPALNWLAWVIVSLGRVQAGRTLFLAYALVFAGDWLWLLVWRYADLLGCRISPDYWDWWRGWLPTGLLIGNLLIARSWWRAMRAGAAARPRRRLTAIEIALRAVAVFLGGWAAVLTAIHLLLPRLPVNDWTLDLARGFLVRPEHRSDFEFILQAAPCRGKRLGAVLQHVELANLQRNHFYKDLDVGVFRHFVLSPVVDALPLLELDWRRTLWENFYPRIRRENEPVAAARTVVGFLRQRVGISARFPYRVGVETIWTQGMTDAAGFERIYVAALRSVGIAARLGGDGKAELLVGNQWQPAPRPLISSWEQPQDAEPLKAVPAACRAASQALPGLTAGSAARSGGN